MRVQNCIATPFLQFKMPKLSININVESVLAKCEPSLSPKPDECRLHADTCEKAKTPLKLVLAP